MTFKAVLRYTFPKPQPNHGKNQINPSWGQSTKYLANTSLDSQGHEKQGKTKKTVTDQRCLGKTWQVNAMWYFGLDPGTERGH